MIHELGKAVTAPAAGGGSEDRLDVSLHSLITLPEGSSNSSSSHQTQWFEDKLDKFIENLFRELKPQPSMCAILLPVRSSEREGMAMITIFKMICEKPSKILLIGALIFNWNHHRVGAFGDDLVVSCAPPSGDTRSPLLR